MVADMMPKDKVQLGNYFRHRKRNEGLHYKADSGERERESQNLGV